MQKYINPYTDFGFKKLFGEEANKDLLIDFLNESHRQYSDSIKMISHFLMVLRHYWCL